MAGLNLSEAVRNYQQGVQFAQQQEVTQAKLADMRRQQQIQRDAGEAFKGVMGKSQQEWMASGAPGKWQPNDETMLQAAHAVGETYLKHGDIEGFAQNEAKVQAQRMRLRAGALERYNADGDKIALIKSTAPTFVPGASVTGVEITGGMPHLPSIGREATPEKVKVKFSTGAEKEFDIKEYEAMLKGTLVDPKAEAEFRIKAALERVKGEEARKTEGVKGEIQSGHIAKRGEQDMTLAGAKHRYDVDLEGVKLGGKKTIQQQSDEAALQRTKTTAAATTGAAAIRAQATRDAANISANAPPKRGARDPSDIKSWEDWHKAGIRFMGEQANTLVGSGTRIGTEDTLAVTRRAKYLAEEQGIDPGLAFQSALEEWKTTKGAGGKK